MFTPQTEAALAANFQVEYGTSSVAVLPAEAYRELLFCARRGQAAIGAPSYLGAPVALVPKPDGSVSIEPL